MKVNSEGRRPSDGTAGAGVLRLQVKARTVRRRQSWGESRKDFPLEPLKGMWP